jgi:hypothetical protein
MFGIIFRLKKILVLAASVLAAARFISKHTKKIRKIKKF